MPTTYELCLAHCRQQLVVSPAKGTDYDPPAGDNELPTIGKSRGVDSWIVHAQGLAGLLHLRGKGRLHTPVERALFWLVNNSIVSPSFLNV
jgi:hypothetical protein